jgi:hypothetical protein
MVEYVVEEVEHLSSKCEALNSNPFTAKKISIKLLSNWYNLFIAAG